MDFVIFILMKVLDMSVDKAIKKMMDVHYEGNSIVGEFDKKTSAEKINEINLLAEQESQPLLVTIKEVEEDK